MEVVVENTTYEVEEVVAEPAQEEVEMVEQEEAIEEQVEEDTFNFDVAYNKLLEGAKANGMYDDIGFQTLMREFRNLNDLCLRMKADIDANTISDFTEGSKGQLTWKTNPVIKDYNTTVKNLVLICTTLEKKLASVSQSDNDDWL